MLDPSRHEPDRLPRLARAAAVCGATGKLCPAERATQLRAVELISASVYSRMSSKPWVAVIEASLECDRCSAHRQRRLFPRTTCRLSIGEHLMPNHVGCDDLLDSRQSQSTEPTQRFSHRIF